MNDSAAFRMIAGRSYNLVDLSFSFALVVGYCVVLMFVFGGFSEGGVVGGTLDPDSDQYLQIASGISGRSIGRVGMVAEFAPGAELRPPFFPLLLAVGMAITGEFSGSTLFLIHLALFLIAAMSLIVVCRQMLRPAVGALVLILFSSVLLNYSKLLLAEWCTFCLLLLWAAALISFLPKRDLTHSILLALMSSFLALTRVEYLFVVVIVGAFGAFELLRRRFRVALGLFLGLAPVLLCMLIYHQRFGVYAIAQTQGHAIGIARLLDEIPTGTMDSRELRESLDQINQSTKGIGSSEWLSLPFLGTQELVAKVCDNVSVTEHLLPDYNWQDKNAKMFEFAVRIIEHNVGSYIIFVALGSLSIVWSAPFVLCFRNRSVLARAGMIVGALHTVRIVLISAVNIMHIRYYVPSFAAFGAVAMLAYIESRRSNSKKASKV